MSCRTGRGAKEGNGGGGGGGIDGEGGEPRGRW